MSKCNCDLALAVRAGIISEGVSCQLQEFFDGHEEPPAHGKLDLAHVLWLLAGICAVFASGAIIFFYVDKERMGMATLLAAVLCCAWRLSSAHFFKKKMTFPSYLFDLVFVLCTLALAISMLDWIGIATDVGAYVLSVTLILVGLWRLWGQKSGSFVLAIWGGLLIAFYKCFELDIEDESAALGVSIATLGWAWAANFWSTINVTFWLNKVGLLLFGFGLTVFVHGEGGDRYLESWFFVTALLMTLVSVFLQYPSYCTAGVSAIFVYLGWLVFEKFGDNVLLVGLILLGAAVLLAYGGLRASLLWVSADKFVNKVLPRWLVALRPPKLPSIFVLGA